MMDLYSTHRVYKNPHDFEKEVRGKTRKRFPNIIVQGDSWFDYWGRNANFFKGPTNLFEAIQEQLQTGANWFDSAVNASTAFQVGQENDFLRLFSQKHVPLDLYLVSAGGNDIFDNLRNLLNEYIPGMEKWKSLSYCFSSNLGNTLADIEAVYHSIFASRNHYVPELPILTHDYASPTVRERGFEVLGFHAAGPWINNVLTEKGYPKDDERNPKALRTRMIVYLHRALSHTLHQTFSQYDRAYVYSSYKRGLDFSSKSDWDDEIHLSPKGCRKMAEDLIRYMKEHHILPRPKF